MKLKVCGMRYEDNIREIAAIGLDYMGFIFFEGSSRHVTDSIPTLSSSIKKVGVFVNASYDTVLEKINTHDLQAVQLHGEESPEFCKSLSGFNIEIIKVFSIKNEFDFETLALMKRFVTFFFLTPKGLWLAVMGTALTGRY